MAESATKEEAVAGAKTPASKTPKLRKVIRTVAIVATVLLLVASGMVGYLYAASPAVIRSPQFEHAHFRMQVLVNGQPEDFGQAKYQAEYEKGGCSTDIAAQPLHFHDNKDQFMHVHWKRISGGMVLKYYGWNLVGGMPSALGYRFDDLPRVATVPIYGKVLPELPKDAKFWIFTGNEDKHQERSLGDFLDQDLETFFGRKSTVNAEAQAASPWNWLLPKALAHGGQADGHDDEASHEKLERINNLLGNVVIFVQADKPSDQQVKERFANLEPLTDSTCAG